MARSDPVSASGAAHPNRMACGSAKVGFVLVCYNLFGFAHAALVWVVDGLTRVLSTLFAFFSGL
jgi:hypothetical protein